jgi:hypothetical protein
MARALFVLGFVVGGAGACLGCGSGSDPTPPPASALHVGGQTGGEAGIRCSTTVSIEPLGFDTDSPLGFSAQDLARSLPSSVARPLAWTDGSSAVLDVTLAYAGTGGYAASCRSNAADVMLALTTSDGALNEVATARVFGSTLERGTVDVELAVSSLMGSLAAAHATLVDASARILVQVDLAAGTASGRILVVYPDRSTEIAAF